MSRTFWLSLALAGAVWAQAPANADDPIAKAAAAAKAAAEKGAAEKTKPAAEEPQPIAKSEQSVPLANLADIMKMPASLVLATVDGVKVTAGEIQAILGTLPPQVRQQALANRRQFLQQYGVTQRLVTEAENAKIPEETPWKERLAATRMQILAQVAIQRKFNEIQVPAEEVEKSYEANKERYAQAKVKAIYIPFTTTAASQADSGGKKLLAEDEAKAKAEDLLAKARGGADFGALAKEHSGDPASAAKDGDFGVIRKTDALPEAIKTVVFSGKTGEVVGPVKQASGFYLFRIEESGPQPFKEIQQTIDYELRSAKFSEWYNTQLEAVDIKEETLGLVLEQLPAPAKPAPAPAKPSSTPEKK